MEEVLQAPRHRLLAARGLQFWTFWNVERRCSAKSIWQVNISALPSSLPPGLPMSLCVTYQSPAYCFFKKLVFIEISCYGLRWKRPWSAHVLNVWSPVSGACLWGLVVWRLWEVRPGWWRQVTGARPLGVYCLFSLLLFPAPKSDWQLLLRTPASMMYECLRHQRAKTMPSSSKWFLPGLLSKPCKSN